ncbi:hypothetical protein BKA93DRAFT_726206, partial [Sparassis latifolia]
VLCAVIVLGLGGHIINFTVTYLHGYYVFTALGVATASLTILTLPVMFIVDIAVSNIVFTSWILIELIWLTILWVLWLSTGAYAGSFIGPCQYVDETGISVLVAGCHESQALEAFSFLAWIPLMVYTITLLVVSMVSANRGSSVWTSSVSEADWASSGSSRPAVPASQYQIGAVPTSGAFQSYQDAAPQFQQPPPSSIV